ncbi:MAG TPA: heparan-alpha-glucosaminide N-acetyltransferase domain-containing protein [Terriglobales bacterium]
MQRERLVSLDVFRGLIIAGMILVTDPGTYAAVYRPLLHAAWNGWTPTDMIFPGFLFIIGVSMVLSVASRARRGDSKGRIAWHVIQRCVLLCVLGLILNGFPYFNLHTLRIPGILQRIALCYLCGGALYLATLKKGTGEAKANIGIIVGVIVALLAGYWAILKFYPVPGFGPGRIDSLGNLGAYIDRLIFGTQHMWAYGLTPGDGVTYDPEGLLSTLPAIASLLIGILAGEGLRGRQSASRRILKFAAVGVVLLLAGWLLNPLLPINKRIWTSTFVLFSSGFSFMAFALCYWIVDIRRWRAWAYPALVLGTNAIFAFALSTIITASFDAIQAHTSSGPVPLHALGYSYIFATWLAPIHASLAYAICIVLLNMAMVAPLYRKRIFLRI